MAVIGREAARAPLTSADINDGIVTAADLASTLDLSSKTLTMPSVTSLDVTGDLTVDTNTLFVDASANAVGIGTSSPSVPLHVSTTTPIIRSTHSSSGDYLQIFHNGSGAYIDFSADPLIIRGASSAERMRIDSSGRVGIGTTSPDATLDVSRSGNGEIAILQTTANRGFSFQSQSDTALQIASVQGSTNLDLWANTLSFSAGGTERMRIDSSGNLLVGKTSADFGSSVGFEANSNDTVYSTRSGGSPLTLNRTTSDGEIAIFRKDGSTVGQINAFGGTLAIGGPNSGIFFNGNGMEPTSGGNTRVDGTENIGAASWRFKDLYLSGGVYLGGTGAANLLDDYEEGTFTPTFEGGSTAGTYELSAANGRYTKIGRQVTINVSIELAAAITGGGSGYAKIGNLPFTYDSSESYGAHTAVFLSGVVFNASATQIVVGRASSADNSILALYEILQNSTSDVVSITDFAANDAVGFTFIYNAV